MAFVLLAGSLFLLSSQDEEPAQRSTDSPAATREAPSGRIAFSAGGSIYTIEADGSELRRLVAGGRGRDPDAAIWATGPAYSPDGTQIAFVMDYDVWLVNADGSDVRRLADVADWQPAPGASNGSVGVSNVAWSPDGAEIAFALQRIGGSGISGAGKVVLSTGEVVRFGPTGASNPPAAAGQFYVLSWLPDDRLAYTWSQDEYVLINPDDGSEAGRLDHAAAPWPGLITQGEDGSLLIGPFGRTEAIVYGSRQALNQIATGTSPVLSPEGQWVAYYAGDSIRLVRTDGSDDHELIDLAPLGGRDRHFAVQPDCYPDRHPACSYRPPLLSWSPGE
jgi:dipeptidyl aminopeptidase/acylaminoacyl peptidase